MVGKPHALDLAVEVGGRERTQRGGADLVRAEDRMVVENAHRRPEQLMAGRLGGVVRLAIGGDEVEEIERQRRIADLAGLYLPRHVGVDPGGVAHDLVEEQVDAVVRLVVRPRLVERAHRDIDPAEPVLESLEQDRLKRRRDRRDGIGVAHGSPRPRPQIFV